MKKVIIILIVFGVSSFVTLQLVNDPLPSGQSGQLADDLAKKMLGALNVAAYDTAKVISWTFDKGGHHYRWDKELDQVEVQWSDFIVSFSTKTLQGSATQGTEELTESALDVAINQAWEFFANDSFWLVAPYKVFDPGTTRQMVPMENGNGLLITYTSGGVTPGDSYLWMLDENYFPKGWKMWTQKVPIKGVEFEWSGWKQYGGFWLAEKHEWLISVNTSNIKVQ
ncbi:MAG: hypothetical protein ACI9A7_001015 [Cyclobacteriaceae bacterium]|jgi:hypothetical protein